MDADSLYTTEEVAERLNVSPKTLASWRRRGINLSYIRVAGQIRYHESFIQSYLKSCVVIIRPEDAEIISGKLESE